MLVRTRKTLTVLGVMAAAAAGGAAYAGAADNSDSAGNDRGQRSAETPLTGATAEKVEAAAQARFPGGTVVRVETDADHGSPYEAHVRKADGTEVEVLVNRQFEVTAVNEMGGPRGRGPHGPPGAHHRQELAALARELGVSRAKLRAALDAVGAGDRPDKGSLAADLAAALGVEASAVEEILEANRPDGQRGPGGPGGHGDIVEALASGLNIDEAKVEDALESLHEQRHDAFAAALAEELGLDAADVEEALDSVRPGPPPRP